MGMTVTLSTYRPSAQARGNDFIRCLCAQESGVARDALRGCHPSQRPMRPRGPPYSELGLPRKTRQRQHTARCGAPAEQGKATALRRRETSTCQDAPQKALPICRRMWGCAYSATRTEGCTGAPAKTVELQTGRRRHAKNTRKSVIACDNPFPKAPRQECGSGEIQHGRGMCVPDERTRRSK